MVDHSPSRQEMETSALLSVSTCMETPCKVGCDHLGSKKCGLIHSFWDFWGMWCGQAERVFFCTVIILISVHGQGLRIEAVWVRQNFLNIKIARTRFSIFHIYYHWVWTCLAPSPHWCGLFILFPAALHLSWSVSWVCELAIWGAIKNTPALSHLMKYYLVDRFPYYGLYIIIPISQVLT